MEFGDFAMKFSTGYSKKSRPKSEFYVQYLQAKGFVTTKED